MSSLVVVALVINVLVVAGLAYGLSRRREAAIHMKIMTTCFVVDLLNVILVEVAARATSGESGESQGAVEQGLRSFWNDPVSVLNFHIVVSVASIVCYIIAIRTGRRLFRTGEGRGTHRKNAVVFIVTRLASFVTSIMVSWPKITGS
jgi:uncharacterized membrane protein YozB (DUF420 family)